MPNPNPNPSSITPPASRTVKRSAQKPGPAPPGSIAINKAINPPKLLNELYALGVTGGLQQTSTGYALIVKMQPATVTSAQIQAVITAHDPTPVPNPTVTQIDNWAQLTAAQKDALMLTVAKKVYNLT